MATRACLWALGNLQYKTYLLFHEQRDRAVVDQFDFHVLAEAAGGHRDAPGGHGVDEDADKAARPAPGRRRRQTRGDAPCGNRPAG